MPRVYASGACEHSRAKDTFEIAEIAEATEAFNFFAHQTDLDLAEPCYIKEDIVPACLSSLGMDVGEHGMNVIHHKFNLDGE